MAFRARYFVIGGVAVVASVCLIGWYFLGGRGEVLKPDGGPVVTVMGAGSSNCRSAARSTSALAKATITRRGCFFGS
jgi:hypothetical protein